VIVPDVNVLIYAFREDQPDHGRYREWLTAAFAADEPVALPGHVFSGFMRVVTNPRVFAPATPPDEAARDVFFPVGSSASVGTPESRGVQHGSGPLRRVQG